MTKSETITSAGLLPIETVIPTTTLNTLKPLNRLKLSEVSGPGARAIGTPPMGSGAKAGGLGTARVHSRYAV